MTIDDLAIKALKRVPIHVMDRMAEKAQAAARACGKTDLEIELWRVRVVWRERFEQAIQELVMSRIHSYIDAEVEYYRESGFQIPPGAKKLILSHLAGVLATDTALVAKLAELQRLPIGPEASKIRISTMDSAVRALLPDIAHGELAREIDLAAGFGGEEN